MLKALLVEIKNVIFKSFYHAIRFGGLLLIPLVYGFSYIFAFYDPFQKTDMLPIAIVTQKYEKNNTASEFERSLANQLTKKSELSTGDLNMKIQLVHTEIDGKNDKDRENQIDVIGKENFATIILPRIEDTNGFKLDEVISNLTDPSTLIIDKVANVIKLINKIEHDENDPNSSIVINNNFKKNYLISFGIDIGSSMFGGGKYMVNKFVDALLDPQFINHVHDNILTNMTDQEKTDAMNHYKEVLNSIGQSGILDFNPVEIHSQMGDDMAKYGYGLAPFFISVAMWIGGMVMTFAVHKKVYDPSIMPGTRYLAKWMLITFGTIAQATILMFGLFLIGFGSLGLSNLSAMYGFAIFSGIIFSAIIQAIRFIIPNRNFGIFVIIILLVLQMSSSGGLFPTETQSAFYRTIRNILPMGHTVTMFRELLYDTNWSVVFYQIGYLSMYLLIVPFAVVAYHNQNLKIYDKHKWKKPQGLHSKYKLSKKGVDNV